MTLRMHSMRKRRVTMKFTMLKASKYSGAALWNYKIHPTHRSNATQILYSVVCALHITFIFPHSLTIISKSLSIKSLSLCLLRVRVEHRAVRSGEIFSFCKIKGSSLKQKKKKHLRYTERQTSRLPRLFISQIILSNSGVAFVSSSY